LGSKACGGPQSYLVLYKKVTDVKKLTELVSQYNLSVQEENKKLGLISTCSVVPQPQVHCKDKTCQAKAGASFNPYIKSTK
ncbi:MAG: hypothetical protein KDD61_04050, partial [Bdellovibrionales bacterium]|nr:hypothetical protein [Bdellovibrionales bacterium]